jgi:hypothetical protein
VGGSFFPLVHSIRGNVTALALLISLVGYYLLFPLDFPFGLILKEGRLEEEMEAV